MRVLPDCRDSGITVFDPVSWRFANGHLTLKSRRGHAVNLVAIGEGRWRRGPRDRRHPGAAEGRALAVPDRVAIEPGSPPVL